MNGEVTERRSQEPGLWSHVDRLSSAAHELGDFACLAQPQHSCRGMGVGTVVPATSGCWGAMCGERLRGFWTRKFSLQGSYSCESSRYLELVNYTICLPRACFLFTHGKWPSPCIREKSPAVHSISAVGGGSLFCVPGQGSRHSCTEDLCPVIPGTAKREEESVFSLDDWWPGIIILWVPGHSAPIISRELSFIFSMLKAHASTVVWNLMAAYTWNDRIPFSVPLNRVLLLQKGSSRGNYSLWL